MKQLKPRDKITQRMTRDGLIEENQTTGDMESVSEREAETDLSQHSAPQPFIHPDAAAPAQGRRCGVGVDERLRGGML